MTEPVVYRSLPVASDVEIRAEGDGARFTGYAAVFGVDSEPLPFTETIEPGAFARDLSRRRDHTFVVDHDDTRLLADRRSGTLTLTEDSKGLLVEAALPATSYSRDLVELHRSGMARSMSFTFRVVKDSSGNPGESWSADQRRRTLRSLWLGHVSALTGLPPAYRQTSASIRALAVATGADADDLAAAVEDLREGRALTADAVALIHAAVAELRGEPADTVIAPPGAPPVPLSVARARLELLAKSR